MVVLIHQGYERFILVMTLEEDNQEIFMCIRVIFAESRTEWSQVPRYRSSFLVHSAAVF